MIAPSSNAHWVVWMSLIFAAVLSILSLPPWLSVARPAWVQMVVIYWVLALPNRFGLFFSFVVGLILDVFLNSLFGLNALGLVLVAFVMLRLHLRLRMFPGWQQAFIVLMVICCYQLFIMWIKSIAGLSEPSVWYLLPSVSSGVLWPWIFAALRLSRRYFSVA